MPPTPSPDPKEIISRFEKLLANLVTSGVDFAVVGGVAVILNGYPRLTFDADILVSDSRENVSKLLKCLEKWSEGWARELKIEEFVAQEGSIRVMEDFDLDIFTRMKGKSLDDFRPRLRRIELTATTIPCLAPEDLIFLKENLWRDKDRLERAGDERDSRPRSQALSPPFD
jgi:hypothetical protein